jgi:hypothetical protein
MLNGFSLNDLYNLMQSCESRLFIFTSLLTYAIDSNNANQIIPLIENLDERLKQLRATNVQKREIYRQFRRALHEKDAYNLTHTSPTHTHTNLSISQFLTHKHIQID